jgi:hypothetical protein
MSYLTTNEDAISTLNCVRKHLKPGGIFIFDVWYGPAVLHLSPGDRLKVLKRNGQTIYRFARPRSDIAAQTVTVNYTLINGATAEIVEESHKLRYFFPQELKLLAKIVGIEVVGCYPFLTVDEPPSSNSWNVTCIYKY